MKLADIRGRACAAQGPRVLDLNEAGGGELPADPMASVTPDWRPEAEALLGRVPLREYREVASEDFSVPVPRPSKILAVALNYRGHAKEANHEVSGEPVAFPKLTSSLCGPYDVVELPDGCSMVDYEAEIVVVVGRISGREVQRGSTGRLIHPIPDLLAWTCRYVTLEPGDLIFTGTPEGVGSSRVPRPT